MKNEAMQKRNALIYGKTGFSKKTIDLIKQLDPKIVFEFGAFNGADTLFYRGILPDAEIYSFEPNPVSYEKAKPLLESENIHFYNCAIGHALKEMNFHYMTNRKDKERASPAGSFYPFTAKLRTALGGEWAFPEPIKVVCTTLELFCQRHGIEQINYIHMDVEGAAPLVLKGMGDLRPEMIYAEIVADWACQGAPSPQVHIKVFSRMGYVAVDKNGADTLFEYGFRKK